VKRRAAILLGVPVGLAALVALPLGLWRGEYQWLCAAVAVALVVPPGVLTLLASGPLARSSPLGPLLALVVGTFGRIVIGFGGAAAVFFASKPTFHEDPISYWAWVLGVYLTTLAVETPLLARTPTPQPKA
jgi:hypothetical protein